MNLQFLLSGTSSTSYHHQIAKARFRKYAWCSLAASLLLTLSACESLASNANVRGVQASPTTVNSTFTNRQYSDFSDSNLNNRTEPVIENIRVSNHALDSGTDDWMSLIEVHYDNAKTLVENELDVDLAHIDLLIVDDEPITREVTRESRRLINAQFGETDFSHHFLKKVMNAQVGTYAALFTSQLSAVMVSRNMLRNFERSLPDDKSIRDAALMTLLIHELVHAADDVRYKIHDNRALNFRASFAQSATFEGHAQWVTRRICKAQNCLQGLQALDNFMFNRDAQPATHSQPIEAISHNVLEYSYVEGERFVAALADRKNGVELIDTLLSSPPEDPIQILAPESFPDVAREQRNQDLIKASLEVDHPWVKGSWMGIQTSPLKGVNLRADPAQREAAIDGFTRLINSMISMQLYDQSEPDLPPIEVTVLQTQTARTATLFARTLHTNAVGSESSMIDDSIVVKTGEDNQQSEMKAHLYRRSEDSTSPYRTTVAVSGTYVVQISGESFSSIALDDYAIRVLLNLQARKLRL